MGAKGKLEIEIFLTPTENRTRFSTLEGLHHTNRPSARKGFIFECAPAIGTRGSFPFLGTLWICLI